MQSTMDSDSCVMVKSALCVEMTDGEFYLDDLLADVDITFGCEMVKLGEHLHGLRGCWVRNIVQGFKGTRE